MSARSRRAATTAHKKPGRGNCVRLRGTLATSAHAWSGAEPLLRRRASTARHVALLLVRCASSTSMTSVAVGRSRGLADRHLRRRRGPGGNESAHTTTSAARLPGGCSERRARHTRGRAMLPPAALSNEPWLLLGRGECLRCRRGCCVGALRWLPLPGRRPWGGSPRTSSGGPPRAAAARCPGAGAGTRGCAAATDRRPERRAPAR